MTQEQQGETIENTASADSPQEEVVKDTNVYTAYPMTQEEESEKSPPTYEEPNPGYYQTRSGSYQQYEQQNQRNSRWTPPQQQQQQNGRQNQNAYGNGNGGNNYQQQQQQYQYQNNRNGQNFRQQQYRQNQNYNQNYNQNQQQNQNQNSGGNQNNGQQSAPSMTQIVNQILQALQQNGGSAANPEGGNAAAGGANSANATNATGSSSAGTLLTQLAPVIKSFMNNGGAAAGQNGSTMQAITNFINQNGGIGAVLNMLGGASGGLGNTSSAASAATGGGLLGSLGSYLGRTLKGKPLRGGNMGQMGQMNQMNQNGYANMNGRGYGAPSMGRPGGYGMPFQGNAPQGQNLPSWNEVQQMVNSWRK